MIKLSSQLCSPSGCITWPGSPVAGCPIRGIPPTCCVSFDSPGCRWSRPAFGDLIRKFHSACKHQELHSPASGRSWDPSGLAREVSASKICCRPKKKERENKTNVWIDTCVEAIWGADPLEKEGGFRSRQYDPEATFNSALATNGTVKWAAMQADLDSSVSQTKAALTLSFSEVNWDFLQSVYGWSALQYQAWARGALNILGVEAQTVALWAGGLLEFWVDGKPHFGGDLYHYRRAPSLIQLSPGLHVVDLRLTRDVRAQGGLDSSMKVLIEAELRDEPITVDQRSLVVSELTDRKLGGTWASVHLQKNIAVPVEILSISAPKVKFSRLMILEMFVDHLVSVDPASPVSCEGSGSRGVSDSGH